MMFRVLTPLRESVWFTRSRTTPSSKMWELSITTVDLSTRLLLGLLLLIRVAMYCKSEMPDDLMVQCEECKDWWTLSTERNYLNCKRRYKMQCCCLCSCWCSWIAIMWYVDLE
ncbi:uncharacterized protein LOC133707079 isoform X1 [Rosa rugosa]|uniref:uncharacterized protein LOC133707079 isoform X1 n=1 Tax=Rosa rugosa TaxID=74645 RepID=UPI002B40C54E|nr:uncharacterized protein LOC133707079 isoform X1 [Rosa rugosa]XP_061988597.1 uncharacterized protein LOC133707079 isoform X1 [Rosa rugosa]